MWEQLEIAAQFQHFWADNSVSVTVTFKPEEADQIQTALEMYESRLKFTGSISTQRGMTAFGIKLPLAQASA